MYAIQSFVEVTDVVATLRILSGSQSKIALRISPLSFASVSINIAKPPASTYQRISSYIRVLLYEPSDPTICTILENGIPSVPNRYCIAKDCTGIPITAILSLVIVGINDLVASSAFSPANTDVGSANILLTIFFLATDIRAGYFYPVQ